MKKAIITILSLFMVLSTLTPGVLAKDDLKLMVDGELITGQDPLMDENNRVLVPVRFVSEALGAKVDWDNKTQTVIIIEDDKTIKLTIGSKEATINGKTYHLDTYARLINGSAYVPVRFISEALNAEVIWDNQTNTINIQSGMSNKLSYYSEPTNAQELNELIKSLPSFKGNTTVSYNNVIINLIGTDIIEDNDIVFHMFKEPSGVYGVSISALGRIVLYKERPNQDEEALIRDILKIYYPTSADKIMKYVKNREEIIMTLDDRQVYIAPTDDPIVGTNIYIGVTK